MTSKPIWRQSECPIAAAAIALGVSERKVTDMLVSGELKGIARRPNGICKIWRTLVRVDSIHEFILRGELAL